MGYVSPDQAQALVSSVLMTIVSEIGDKTFFIAAIMAMKHSRLLIFSAAISALAVMTVLSAMLGHLLPKLVPRSYVEMAAALLFLVFGAKMLLEGWAMDADHAQKEMDETSAELEEGHKAEEAYELEAGEFAIGAGGGSSEQSAHGSGPPPVGLVGHAYAMLQTVMSPVFLQTALIMFVAEWGDRSQLATIALAAAQDVFWVSVGTIFGHSICTGLAVVGGRFLATQISVRTVTLSGGLLFIIFGLIYGYEAFMTMSAV
ncbi:hypothetical protein BJ085DRAFT_15728 [Dimargaris cristalligena]|uniref:GDT1 family protein n=1 Tax=Dimargaris cristalligena TaxID=215637 RepID=A0A4P9ZTP8_9FUNG|nr:hypothetical protein BJ085DRAFT_15728 [Dimargaris cristalligena]|eukprot:RKP35920.1 hypothetical protein BJ085DRAFT_15728 [Dimargaris cristalligena]